MQLKEWNIKFVVLIFCVIQLKQAYSYECPPDKIRQNAKIVTCSSIEKAGKKDDLRPCQCTQTCLSANLKCTEKRDWSIYEQMKCKRNVTEENYLNTNLIVTFTNGSITNITCKETGYIANLKKDNIPKCENGFWINGTWPRCSAKGAQEINNKIIDMMKSDNFSHTPNIHEHKLFYPILGSVLGLILIIVITTIIYYFKRKSNKENVKDNQEKLNMEEMENDMYFPSSNSTPNNAMVLNDMYLPYER